MTSYAQQLADSYNAQSQRSDIEWAVGPNDTLYLRDKFSFTQRNTDDIEARNEQQRRIWKACRNKFTEQE